MCFAIRRGGRAVGRSASTTAPSVAADALVVTCPLPQSASLLMTAEVAVPEQLRRTDYHRIVAVLAALDGPGAVPAARRRAGRRRHLLVRGRQPAQGRLRPCPALTLHVNHEESAAHWDDPPDELRAWALDAAAPWFGDAAVVAARVRRWRFAGPQTIWPESCWTPESGPAAGPRRRRLRRAQGGGRGALRAGGGGRSWHERPGHGGAPLRSRSRPERRPRSTSGSAPGRSTSCPTPRRAPSPRSCGPTSSPGSTP